MPRARTAKRKHTRQGLAPLTTAPPPEVKRSMVHPDKQQFLAHHLSHYKSLGHASQVRFFYHEVVRRYMLEFGSTPLENPATDDPPLSGTPESDAQVLISRQVQVRIKAWFRARRNTL
ncbi:hypothetical protein C8R43DRAFT_1126329 [Mycena crocata]|nr:hypothetical protein C8R43DRAFT_1126329 [Mycena crocata]